MKKKKYEDYNVNPTQFINPTTPECVYILGLIWADGGIFHKGKYANISLTTTYPDFLTFNPIMLKTGKWRMYFRKSELHPTWKERCDIITSNRPLVEFLIKNDYQSKSIESADKILSIIPNHLKHYWFRGLLDGDGHIHTDNKGSHSISFSSSIEQNWKYLENLCKSLNIKCKIKRRTSKKGHGQSSFSIYSMYKTIKFCEYIYNGYPEDNIGLKRKYDKFLQLKSTEEKNRYKGVSKMKSGKWRAYTSGANNLKPKGLGVFDTEQEAVDTVHKYYQIHPKVFIN